MLRLRTIRVLYVVRVVACSLLVLHFELLHPTSDRYSKIDFELFLNSPKKLVCYHFSIQSNSNLKHIDTNISKMFILCEQQWIRNVFGKRRGSDHQDEFSQIEKRRQAYSSKIIAKSKCPCTNNNDHQHQTLPYTFTRSWPW